MREINFTFDDLMKELGIEDPVQLGKLIRVNRLPEVSRSHQISRKDAALIVKTLRGREIDWYKYKARERDLTTTGPLKRVDIIDIPTIIEHWYLKFSQNQDISSIDQNRVLGLVCKGGFLEEHDFSEFIIAFDPKINVLIGDRGSGKSTILNLLGVLTDSVSEETNALTTRVLDILSVDQEIRIDQIARLTRRARGILSHYGINILFIYYVNAKVTSCFYVDISNNLFDVYERRKEKWKQSKIGYQLGPSMLILQQAEVIRIAEERQKFYLNNILDAIYPDLHHKRTDFALQVKNIVSQYHHTPFDKLGFRPKNAFHFINQRSQELQEIVNEINRGLFTDESINIIQTYLNEHNNFVDVNHPYNHNGWKYEPLYQLLSNEDAYYTLYIGRIEGFLVDKISEIISLKEKRPANTFPESGQILVTDQDDEPEIISEISAEKSILDELIRQEQIEDTIDKSTETQQTEENSEEEYDFGGEDTETRNEDRKLFLEAIKALEFKPERESSAVIDIALEIVDFLNTRLRVLNSWVYIYSARRIRWNKPFKGLVNSHKQLLSDRIKLIEAQQNRCRDLAKTLNNNDFPLRIYTINATEQIAAHRKEVREIQELDQFFSILITATPKSKLWEITPAARAYDSITQKSLRLIRDISRKINNPQHDFVFNPIDIELLQGNIYRRFEQLSFGQKSGIILGIVLLTTNRRLIVIDQPEDNLDTNSIVNMVAPTLNRLGNDRQVILATHNSNLVMGLDISKLFVLESRGENGRVKMQGAPIERRVIRELMEVLEGGVTTFESKLKMYEDFISRVRGQIQDIDIAWIESSFRKRTIDRFRNFLQPILSDRSLLDFARHQFKQPNYNYLRNEINEFRHDLGSFDQKNINISDIVSIVTKLDELALHLDSHISYMLKAIEEIRYMDTESKPKKVDLYKLLSNLKTDIEDDMHESAREIRIRLDDKIADYVVYADEDHLRLIFNNLFNNSLDATESKAVKALETGTDISEIIEVVLDTVTDSKITLKFSDNGSGMPSEIKEKLYVERCTTQKGRDDGLGGVIIRKLLDLNSGEIRIIESNQGGAKTGTLQSITLPRKVTL